jgi:hypothetical protein
MSLIEASRTSIQVAIRGDRRPCWKMGTENGDRRDIFSYIVPSRAGLIFWGEAADGVFLLGGRNCLVPVNEGRDVRCFISDK